MSIETFYGRWARLYDAIATGPGVGAWRAAAADALDLSPGDTVVEVGCGTGANAPYLRQRVGPKGQVVGVDLTRPLLDRGRERVARRGWTNVHFVHGDAREPPIDRVDAVLATFLVGLLPDPEGAVETWCDLTTGRVALLDATSSTRPVGRPLNPLFGAFVSAGAPADSLGETLGRLPESRAARRRLDERVQESRRALVRRTTERRYETFGLDFVGLLSGQVSQS